MKLTQLDHYHRSITVVSKVIDKTVGDLRWPRITYQLLATNSILVDMDGSNYCGPERSELIFCQDSNWEAHSCFPFWLKWKNHDTDLTLGHLSKKSEIYKFEVTMTSCYPPTFKLFGHILSVGHARKLLEVVSVNVIWWPDLTWPRPQYFLHNMHIWCWKSCAKFGGAARLRF